MGGWVAAASAVSEFLFRSFEFVSGFVLPTVLLPRLCGEPSVPRVESTACRLAFLFA
jgi:hypothetical protein